MAKLDTTHTVTPNRYSLLLLVAAALSGCASPGPPRAPSLHLPKIVADLTAERIGDTVLLRWTTPAKTTDGLNAGSTTTAQICRQVAAAAGRHDSCTPVRRLPTKPGPAQTVDTLPPALLRDPAVVLVYRVELLNASEHSAGLSAPAMAVGGPAPSPVAGLRVESTAEGALLQWTANDATAPVELDRLHTASAPISIPASDNHVGTASHQDDPAEVHLLATQNATALPDPGGTIDRTARPGETYTYTAQRVRHLVLDGQSLVVRSAVSLPVTITVRDTFPPRPPTRVEAIANGIAAASAIDLSWTPNTETDLAGYLVYRQELGGQMPSPEALQITPSLVMQPAFRDTAVRAGHLYSYTVVAVDTTGNRSAPSAPAQEELKLP